MAKVANCKLERHAAFEPLYDIDPRTGASIEVFYADSVLAKSFDTRPGVLVELREYLAERETGYDLSAVVRRRANVLKFHMVARLVYASASALVHHDRRDKRG